MEQDEIVEENPVEAVSIGGRLRQMREQKGLSIEEVAAQTRIPQRHLVSIEADEFKRLPSRTYAVGFTRTYAKTLGLDEHDAVNEVREALAAGDPIGPASTAKFEPGDPARVPGRGLAWFGAVAAIVFIAGLYAFYSSYFAPGLGPAPLSDTRTAPAATQAGTNPASPARSAAVPRGPVVFTATMDDTWVKFYEGSGERLYEAQMAKGESFTVPADSDNPQIWTGRPYALDITIGGRGVPKLSEDDTIVRDVPVSAQALLARADAQSSAPVRATTTARPTGDQPAAVGAD